MTSDLRHRLRQHACGELPGFTRRYGITTLVYVEEFTDVHLAITREKQLKRWPRWRKLRLIEASNATWTDLGAAWDAEDVGRRSVREPQAAVNGGRQTAARSACGGRTAARESDPDTRSLRSLLRDDKIDGHAFGGAPAG